MMAATATAVVVVVARSVGEVGGKVGGVCENIWLLGLINCEYLAADCKAFSLARKEHQ